MSSFREEGVKKFGLEHYKKFNGAPIDVFGRSGSEPTFWEFVQGIVKEGRSQNHFHVLASASCSWYSSVQTILKLKHWLDIWFMATSLCVLQTS